MSRIKKDILNKIKQKAKAIKDHRDQSNKKSLEDAVFDFFQFIEESRRLYNNKGYPHELINIEKEKLENELRHLDRGIRIVVEQDIDYTDPTKEGMIRGITVWWSPHYIAQNNCEQSIYFDVTNILLGGL